MPFFTPWTEMLSSTFDFDFEFEFMVKSSCVHSACSRAHLLSRTMDVEIESTAGKPSSSH